MNSTGQIKHQAIMDERRQQQQRLHQTSMDNRITRTNRSATHDQLPNKGSRMSAKDRAVKQQLRESQAIQAMHFGALEERERIIKLLKPYAKDCENGDCNCLSAESVIALIKGGNK